ncbi:hypothetical protein AGOR_G00140900 [Albula goreensis]|uniref:Uncharacterized protein n=1 Tax=Albula goreensis TaxID=1534307 RepID=A0A8T3DF84_9TELE|nr:hypothetical protein AGOR_G00140900 [Albula goreensis]
MSSESLRAQWVGVPQPGPGAGRCDWPQASQDRWEIYVPKEAAVRSVPVESLPVAVLRRMGVSDRPRAAGSASATWISPVVIREKGTKVSLPISHCRSVVQAWLNTVAGTSSPRGQLGQCWLPVSCSNLLAFKVLREFLPPRSRCTSSPSQEQALRACQPDTTPLGLPLNQDAIVIHSGRIFLSIMKALSAKSRAEALPVLAQPPPPRVPDCSHSTPEAWEPSGTPPKKPTPSRPLVETPSGAMLQTLGIQHRAQVTLTKLPDAVLEASGCDHLGRVPLEGQLSIKAECSRLSAESKGRAHGGGTQDSAGRPCTEDLTRTRRTQVRKKSMSHDTDTTAEGEGLPEPMAKKGEDGAVGGAVADWADTDYAPAFDFELSAREEKIDRIRAQLREKEAALKRLTHPV